MNNSGKKRQPPRVLLWPAHLLPPPTHNTCMKIKSPIHLTLSCPGVFLHVKKEAGLQSVPMASQKLLILTGLGNPEMDMTGIQRIPHPGCNHGKGRFSLGFSLQKKCDLCGKIVGYYCISNIFLGWPLFFCWIFVDFLDPGILFKVHLKPSFC